MTKAPASGISLAGLLIALSAAPQEPERVSSFTAQADAITVDAVVLDGSGHPVTGLGKDDFTVLDEGRPQPLVGFEARTLAEPGKEGLTDDATPAKGLTRTGRTIAFILDDLGTEHLDMSDGTKAIVEWLGTKADPGDDVTLVTTSGDAWWTATVGEGGGDLVAVLGRIRGKKISADAIDAMSDWEAYRIEAFEGATSGADALDAQGAAAISEASPNALCIRPSGSNPGDLIGRVVDRWMAAKVCQCEATTGTTIMESRQSCGIRAAGRAREIRRAALERAQALLGAIDRISRGLAGSRGRKSILVFSDGLVRDTQLAGFEAAVSASQRANTAVSFIDLRGLKGATSYRANQGTPPKAGDLGAIDLEQSILETAGTEYVADATGGLVVKDTNDLLGGLARVAAESSAYYLLGYQPQTAPDGKWHRLEVKVSRPGLTVRARRGYYAAAPLRVPAGDVSGAQPSDKGPKRPLDPALEAGAHDDAIPLRIAPYVLEPDGAGSAHVRVVVELDTSKVGLEGGGNAGRASVDLTLLAAGRDRGRLAIVDQRLRFDVTDKTTGGWLTLSRDLHLPQGIALLRALARDVSTGRAGSAQERFEVPALNAPYITTPLLTDHAESSTRDVLRLLPIARRQFLSSEVLYCRYDVEGMTDSRGQATLGVMGGYTLQALDGAVVRQGPPTMIAVGLGGEVSRTFKLPLEGLAPGEYQLVIDVTDNATSRSLVAHERFSVEDQATGAKQDGSRSDPAGHH